MKNQMYSLSTNERGKWKKILLIKRKKICLNCFSPYFPQILRVINNIILLTSLAGNKLERETGLSALSRAGRLHYSILGVLGPIGGGIPDPKIFLGSPGSSNRSSGKN